MRDFTLKTYRQLLETLLAKGYRFTRFDDWAESTAQRAELKVQSKGKISQFDRNDKRIQVQLMERQDANTLSALLSPLCVLRHDVDRLPENSLVTAKIEAELGIKGTYYFRIVPESFDERIIKDIAALGHEIGYHYEELDTAYRQVKSKKSKVKSKNKTQILRYFARLRMGSAQNDSDAYPFDSPDGSGQAAQGDTSTGSVHAKYRMTDMTNNQQTTTYHLPTAIIDQAYELFKVNLEKMRNVVEIKTICMHGSPLSPFDNKMIWQKYDYKDLGIIGEPYFDMNWNEFVYLTDTGRRWDGGSVAVRDKVKSQMSKVKGKLKSTNDIIQALEQNQMPDKIMITVHPERWTDSGVAWVHELIWQNFKNVVKKSVVRRQNPDT